MPIVVGVHFRNAGKRQFYLPGNLEMGLGTAVIVPTAQGLDYAHVCQMPQDLPQDELPSSLKQVLRLANAEDERQLKDNQEKEERAIGICRDRIAAHKLDMKLVSVEYTFDSTKLIAYFTSGGRVDFRALVKELAGIFRMRIELRQIGVRDEAKMLGGFGSCGRGLCCSNFLYEFQPVSIRMAKEQSLSLNPTKISGVCGRLMCCLKYEQDQYEKSRKRMPRLGKEVGTPKGRGIVTQLNPLLETLQVRIGQGDSSSLHIFSADEVQRLQAKQEQRPGKAARREALVVDESAEEFLETTVEHHCDDGRLADD